jgi:hypothetical protein
MMQRVHWAGRRLVRGVLGVVLFVALTASLVAVHTDRRPWATLGLIVLGIYLVWETFRKLTSDVAVIDWWDGHIRSFLMGAAVFIGGIGLAATGGDDGSAGNHVVGFAVAAVGGVLLVAERRDFRLWRAELRRDRDLEQLCRERTISAHGRAARRDEARP